MKLRIEVKRVRIIESESEIFDEVRFGELMQECLSFTRFHKFDDETVFYGISYVYIRSGGQRWSGADVIRFFHLERDRLNVRLDEHSATWSDDFGRPCPQGPSEVEVSFALVDDQFFRIRTRLERMFGEFDWYVNHAA